MQSLPTETVAKLSPQDALVYEYLLSGRALTQLVALVNLGVGSLTARIATLRKLGLKVSDEWSQDHFKRRYKKYQITGGSSGE